MYGFVPYFQPFFETHYGVGKAIYGLVVMLSIVGLMVGSGVSTMVEGFMGNKGALVMGFAFFLLGYMMLGPSPLLPWLDLGVWEAGLGMGVLLFGQAFSMVLCAPLIVKYGMAKGISMEDAAIQTATLSITLMAIALFFGPLLGGVLAENYGAQWANTLNGVSYAAVAAFALIVLFAIDQPSSNELL